jgi:predicted metalloprotease with PDZ domain
MIAGALTGGIGLGLGVALSGGRYEYVDATNFTPKTLKYKGGELRKLQEQGLHVIVVNKKATAEEIQTARQSCRQMTLGDAKTTIAPGYMPPTSPLPASEASRTATVVNNKPPAPETGGTTGPLTAGSDPGSIGVWSNQKPMVRHDGVVIAGVVPQGPADRAELRAGDCILAIGEHYLFTVEELSDSVRSHKPGEKVAIRFRRDSTIYDTYLIMGRSEF